MLTQFCAPGSNSLAPRIALHEVGAAIEARPLSCHRENRAAAELGPITIMGSRDQRGRPPARERRGLPACARCG